MPPHKKESCGEEIRAQASEIRPHGSRKNTLFGAEALVVCQEGGSTRGSAGLLQTAVDYAPPTSSAVVANPHTLRHHIIRLH